jgi:hypothetical protein
MDNSSSGPEIMEDGRELMEGNLEVMGDELKIMTGDLEGMEDCQKYVENIRHDQDRFFLIRN